MKAKSLGIAALSVAVPPFGMAYLSYKYLDTLQQPGENIGFVPSLIPAVIMAGFATNLIFITAAELGVNYVKKPDIETVYSTSDITVRYNAEDNTPKVLLREAVVNVITSYGIIEPFFRERSYSPVTELSVTPSHDYSCQWRMDEHFPLETILQTELYTTSNPKIMFGNTVATDTHIVDYATQTCLALLATQEKKNL